MAIDTIGTNAIANDAVTAAKIPDGAVDADLGAVHSVISVKGTIINSIATTLTIEIGGKFASSVNVKYYEGSTLVATDSSRTVTNGTLTSTVPSAVYGQSVGDTIAIKIESGSSLSANSVDKTVITAPSGGTITTSGDYRIHTFTSSNNFTVAANTMLRNVEYLVIGGGGGAGYHTGNGYYHDAVGGGGAGGYRCSVPGETSGGGVPNEAPIPFLTTGTYHCQVGAGGAAGGASATGGSAGGASIFGGETLATGDNDSTNREFAFFYGAVQRAQYTIHSSTGSLPIMSFGGGGSVNVAWGQSGPHKVGGAGGSAGGSGHSYSGADTTTIGAGVNLPRQGFTSGTLNGYIQAGTGGGGAGGGTVSLNTTNKGTTNNLNGGIGLSSSITGSAVLRGGGGAAGGSGSAGHSTNGGAGVAGGGNGGNHNAGAAGTNGTANTGGGGGGSGSSGSASAYASGAGGSGVIILRYKLNEVDNFL